ncbi:Yip1 family protein [Candidatus Chlorohelix sp.]|uniref:Yip1 family protein n=1 Tax=Candidatus Chlorohelix sp. TaxID=3139201 RepID=UPI0030576ED6
MNKVLDEFRNGPTDILCPECRELNPIDDEKCFNCETELLKPVSLWRNFADVIIRPLVAMKRIAATMPYWQGAFLYFLLIAIVAVSQVASLLSYGQNVLDKKIEMSRFQVVQVLDDRNGEVPLSTDQRAALTNNSTDSTLNLTDAQLTELNDVDDQRIRLTEKQFVYLRDNTDSKVKLNDKQIELNNPQPDQVPNIDSSFIGSFLINAIIRVAFTAVFAMALSVVARLFYKEESRTNFKSLFAIATFAQVNLLILGLLYLIPIGIPSLLPILHDPGFSRGDVNIYVIVIQFAPLLWQLALLITGVHFSMKLSWNRSALVVLIPALLLKVFLQVPF